ncbi:hypothetical protein C8R43DRAFT_1137783 [Mycena crocata]|nr:hypothetical protein C8R43DRAFT_1137783 [Mycena crocata]
MSSATKKSEVDADSDAARFNKQGGELFKAGQYMAAAAFYASAIKADTTNSSVYCSNLSAAYLKIGNFTQAERAARVALLRDPKSTKARYRRAMARKGRNRLAEALVDLSSLLSTAPENSAAKSAFASILVLYEASGESRISPDDVIKADFPCAFGPVSTLELDLGDPKFDVTQSTLDDDGTPETETCGLHLPKHDYFRTHLGLYGVRALGLQHPSNQLAPPTRILLVVTDMVPVTAARRARKRLRVKNILAAPLAVLPAEIVSTHTETFAVLRKAYPDTPLLTVCVVTTGVYGEAENTRYNISPFCVPSSYLRPNATIALHSQSLGVERVASLNLDALHANIEEELKHDRDNYYKLQGTY